MTITIKDYTDLRDQYNLLWFGTIISGVTELPCTVNYMLLQFCCG